MPYYRGNDFFFTANQSPEFPHSQIRQISDSQVANATASSVSFGTNTSERTIQLIPGVNGNTVTKNQPIMGPEQPWSGRGWVIRPSDLVAPYSPHERFIYTGEVSHRLRINFSSIDTYQFTIWLVLFALDKDDMERSDQQWEGTYESKTTAAVTQNQVNINFVTNHLSFSENTTIGMDLYVTGKGGGSTGLLSQTVSFLYGPSTVGTQETKIVYPGKGLCTYYKFEDGDYTVTAKPDRVDLDKKLSLEESVDSSGDSSVERASGFKRDAFATSDGLVADSKLVTKRDFIPISESSAYTTKGISKGYETSAISDATRNSTVRKSPSLIDAVGESSMDRLASFLRREVSVAEGSTDFSRIVTFVRSLPATAMPNIEARIEIPMSRIPEGGGGQVVVKKPIFIFDD